MNNKKNLIYNYINNNLLNGNVSDLKNNSMLIEQGLVDSFGIIQVINFIEKEFNINLSQDDINTNNFRSIDSITKLLEHYEKI